MVNYKTAGLSNQQSVEYALVLPDAFDPQRAYPLLLTFPPGPQSRDMVTWGLSGYWQAEAQRRGWIVISPAAPNGILFFKGSEVLIPEFLDQVTADYMPEGDKIHLAGISNGGISAFRVALNNPDRFHSLTVLPGFPPTNHDMEQLPKLKAMPVTMFVGEHDIDWVDKMAASESDLMEAGGQVSFDIVRGEGHVIQSLVGGRELFDLLDSFRSSG
ncbi:MAG: hypothetical protein KDJ65_09315 [Anaerolineae bacterium]|nr:hypothetical protein [Anaerolineae bacterium]